MKKSLSSSAILPAAALALAAFSLNASAQSYQTHNLTPDGFWHNRYHALLSMAAYGNYNETCPVETFTQAEMLKNFPNSTRVPWTVVSTFGPTPSGCEGFTAIVPEMNKALIIFKGDYDLEQNLDQTVTSWDAIGLGDSCRNCTVNAFAARGYMEAKNATNNFQAIREQYYNSGLVFSIAGHGLGGMHSQIASVDFYQQEICYYSHAYGAPRVFNAAGAQHYNDRFNGEAGERGIANNDQYTEFIPASENYTHAGTPFYYYGLNATSSAMNWEICWEEDGLGTDACLPRPQPGSISTPVQDHYFYFDSVGSCGASNQQNLTEINQYLLSTGSTFAPGQLPSAPVSSTSTRRATHTSSRATTSSTRNYNYPPSVTGYTQGFVTPTPTGGN